MSTRRRFIQQVAALATLSTALPQVARAQTATAASHTSRNYVLAHGSWHGGWC